MPVADNFQLLEFHKYFVQVRFNFYDFGFSYFKEDTFDFRVGSKIQSEFL